MFAEKEVRVTTARRRWGFSEAEWADARRALEQMLAEAGRSHSTVTYGEVARRALGGRVSARSSALMDLLGEVDSAADARLGCMVASLVVTTGILGPEIPKHLAAGGKLLIVVALAGVGLGANLSKMITIGARPILLGLLVWCLVAATSLAVQLVGGQM